MISIRCIQRVYIRQDLETILDSIIDVYDNPSVIVRTDDKEIDFVFSLFVCDY